MCTAPLCTVLRAISQQHVQQTEARPTSWRFQLATSLLLQNQVTLDSRILCRRTLRCLAKSISTMATSLQDVDTLRMYPSLIILRIESPSSGKTDERAETNSHAKPVPIVSLFGILGKVGTIHRRQSEVGHLHRLPVRTTTTIITNATECACLSLLLIQTTLNN